MSVDCRCGMQILFLVQEQDIFVVCAKTANATLESVCIAAG